MPSRWVGLGRIDGWRTAGIQHKDVGPPKTFRNGLCDRLRAPRVRGIRRDPEGFNVVP
jgi:hypothetical protein